MADRTHGPAAKSLNEGAVLTPLLIDATAATAVLSIGASPPGPHDRLDVPDPAVAFPTKDALDGVEILPTPPGRLGVVPAPLLPGPARSLAEVSSSTRKCEVRAVSVVAHGPLSTPTLALASTSRTGRSKLTAPSSGRGHRSEVDSTEHSFSYPRTIA